MNNEPVAWTNDYCLELLKAGHEANLWAENEKDVDDIPLYTHPANCRCCNGYGLVGNIEDTVDCPLCHGEGVETHPAKTLTTELQALLASVNGDCYLGKEKEEALVAQIKKQYSKPAKTLTDEDVKYNVTIKWDDKTTHHKNVSCGTPLHYNKPKTLTDEEITIVKEAVGNYVCTIKMEIDQEKQTFKGYENCSNLPALRSELKDAEQALAILRKAQEK
jgi:hypothetical protein